jgi:uncharacterized protein
MAKIIINYILITAILLLVGCSTNYRNNNYLQANQTKYLTEQAEQYLKTAENCDDVFKKNNLLLASAELLIQDHNHLWAEKILNQINHNVLTPSQHATLQILLATINLIQKNFNKAKELLSSISTYQNIDNDIYKKLYSTKINLFLQSGEILEAIQDQITLERFLTTSKEIADNNKNIWNNLQQLTPYFLELANQENFNNKMQGWINIAIITKKYDADQDELAKAISSWQAKFPDHPANNILNLPNANKINRTIKNQFDQENIITAKNSVINKIALLLPISGPHKKSALAIKNGFLAALYNKKSEYKKPKVIILDTNDKSIINVYKQATLAGVDFIVGPLLKQELEFLAKSNQISVPTLALNTLPDNKLYSKLLFQFGLPPETESHSITEKAWENHHKNAILITQNNDLGKRMMSGIIKNWQDLGGNIINVIQINNKIDLSSLLKEALGIEDSEYRAQELKSLGIKFNFEPRRRQDIDCIFLITNAEHARQIKPLLNFYYTGQIPIYAASSIYSGIKSALDRDLDNIKFCDMPWMLDNSIHNRLIYQSIRTLWSKDFAPYARLYALGIDAYKLSNQIQQLVNMPEVGMSGMTGMLKINENNIIARQLMWGTFEKGAAIILNQKN